MSSRTISDLPSDLIILIAIQAKAGDEKTSNLLNFILVNKLWYYCGRRILYGNIALNNMTLERFTNSFAPYTYGPLVRSMTLDIEKHHLLRPNEMPHFPQSDGFSSARPHPDVLTQTPVHKRIFGIVKNLPKLRNLSSFSLRLGLAPDRTVGRKLLVDLLERLPTTCTNIELDTHGQDSGSLTYPAHVCDAIRQILPRMEHVRIRTGAMCSNIFGTHTTSDDGTRVFSPIVVPNIKSLVLSCSTPFGGLVQRCREHGKVPPANGCLWPHDFAWSSITCDLELFVGQNPEAAKHAKIHAMCTTQANNKTRDCVTDISVDMVAKKGLAFLILPLDHAVEGRLLYRVRLHDGSEIVSTLRDIEVLTEGNNWINAIGGARLPAHVFEAEEAEQWSYALGCIRKPLSWVPLDEWTPKYPLQLQPYALLNEEATNQRLMFSETRTGNSYLSNRPINEHIPPGWVRKYVGLLVREETQ